MVFFVIGGVEIEGGGGRGEVSRGEEGGRVFLECVSAWLQGAVEGVLRDWLQKDRSLLDDTKFLKVIMGGGGSYDNRVKVGRCLPG